MSVRNWIRYQSSRDFQRDRSITMHGWDRAPWFVSGAASYKCKRFPSRCSPLAALQSSLPGQRSWCSWAVLLGTAWKSLRFYVIWFNWGDFWSLLGLFGGFYLLGNILVGSDSESGKKGAGLTEEPPDTWWEVLCSLKRQGLIIPLLQRPKNSWLKERRAARDSFIMRCLRMW